jgi:HAD superfamily hydrolase (TIGR01484 family)
VTFSAFGQKAPIEIKETWDKDHAKRAEMIKVLAEYLPDFASHIGGTTSIDVTRKGIDKAYGLNNLLDYLKIPKEKLLYIGDELFEGGNDEPAKRATNNWKQVKDPEEAKTVITELLLA